MLFPILYLDWGKLVFLGTSDVPSSGYFRSVDFLLDALTATFCLVLVSITLYAWTRRGRPRSLIFFAAAFLVFFFRQLIEFVPLPVDTIDVELTRSVLDFLTLSLVFVGLVLVGPQRKTILKDLK